ncbi:hypothetical protein OQA88_2169 [Cercophora sp. LCS_1]
MYPPEMNGTSGTDRVDVAIASQPGDVGAVPGLLADIADLQHNLDLGDRYARLYFLDKARKLVQALETPRETVLRHVGAETATFYMITLGVDIGLFAALAKNHGSPKKAVELSKTLNFSLDALRRILRHLAAVGHLHEAGPDEYKPNNFSLALSIPLIANGYPMYRDIVLPPMQNLHKWLATKSYATPTTAVDNPYTFGHQTHMSMFEHMASLPRSNAQFNDHMGAYRLGRPPWHAFYPLPTTKTDPSSPLLVDIGGSLGHDLLSLRESHPNLTGRLILQDTAAVLSSAPHTTLSSAGIEAMPHDFFSPQPVKGAKMYYLHHILHDWPDDKCVEIIKNIKDAMTPGYSRLLVNEHIIPATGASWEATYLDLYMMVLFGARERTEDEWKVLLEGAGLKVLGVWRGGGGVEGVVECEVAVGDEDGK